MSKEFKLIYNRKRLLSNFFRVSDTWELWGFEIEYFPDLTYGNGGSSDTRKVFTCLETFTSKSEAERVLSNYKKEDKK